MRTFLLLFLSLLACYMKCQDTLYFKNNDKIIIQLLEVNPTNLKYKRFDNQAGPTYTVLKEEVTQVMYANGKKDIFNISAKDSSISKPDSVLKNPVTSNQENKAVDTLYFKSGIKTPAKIYELTETTVKYKPLKNLDGPVYTINKSDLKEVVFSTGLKQTFNVQSPNPLLNTATGGTPGSFQLKGMRDAKTYYKNKGGSIGTGITAFIFPPAGLVPAIICSCVPPKERNLGYPDENLWENKDYRLGYTKEAYRIKRKRVWTGFGIGTAAAILLGFVLSR